MKNISTEFYLQQDVVAIAKQLLGKIILTNFNNTNTSVRIVETEAYIGLTDKASHSFNGRRTAKNEHMYAVGGTSYVYICYGMHHLFNIVTNKKLIPDAVLIRAGEPLEGTEYMIDRTNKNHLDKTITKGPGNVSKALGIYKHHSGLLLGQQNIFIKDDGFTLKENEIGISKRIGVESAGLDGLLPYRFYVRSNNFISGSPVT